MVEPDPEIEPEDEDGRYVPDADDYADIQLHALYDEGWSYEDIMLGRYRGRKSPAELEDKRRAKMCDHVRVNWRKMLKALDAEILEIIDGIPRDDHGRMAPEDHDRITCLKSAQRNLDRLIRDMHSA